MLVLKWKVLRSIECLVVVIDVLVVVVKLRSLLLTV